LQGRNKKPSRHSNIFCKYQLLIQKCNFLSKFKYIFTAATRLQHREKKEEGGKEVAFIDVIADREMCGRTSSNNKKQSALLFFLHQSLLMSAGAGRTVV
jgi:hypothetical protein